MVDGFGLRALGSAAREGGRITVPRESLTVKFVRSSGPGGQNVNKVSTKAEVRFVIGDAEWLPPEASARLRQQQQSRVNKRDELVVQSDGTRSQHKNLRECIDKVQQMVDEACVEPKEREMWSGLGEQTKRRRVEQKRRRSDVKSNRRVSKHDW